MRHNQVSQDTHDALIRRETDLSLLSQTTDARLADVEASLAQLQLMDTSTQEESDSDDLASAVVQLEEELVALKASHALVPVLSSQLESISREQVTINQKSATMVTFGQHSQGIQLGINNGPINITGFTFGRSL